MQRSLWKICFVGLLLAGALLAGGRRAEASATCTFYSHATGYVCLRSSAATSPFATPEQPEDSLLAHSWYARLNDNINVYAEPGLNAPIVRNVGDGFLFASLQAYVSHEGEGWYMINPGEYVRESDLKIVPMSEFAGVEVLQQPLRPFGWFLVDWRPSSTPGGEPDTYFPRLPRYTFFEVYDAAVDDEGWIWYNIGWGRWIKQIYVSVMDVTQRPEGVGPEDFWVTVDLYEQNFAAYEGNRMVYASLVSSGLNQWPTNEGLFQVWDRWERTPMSGAEGQIDYYVVEDVPHTMFFDDDIALHGAYWHDRFGYKHSHGCVNMPPRDAEWVYYWSQNAPQALWVQVYSSDPHTYFVKHDGGGMLYGAFQNVSARNLIVQ